MQVFDAARRGRRDERLAIGKDEGIQTGGGKFAFRSDKRVEEQRRTARRIFVSAGADQDDMAAFVLAQ